MRGNLRGPRQLAWRRRNAGICRSSSSRAGLARSVMSIEVCTGAGRMTGLGAATTFSGTARGAGLGGSAAIGAPTAGVAALGVANAPVMRWNRLGVRPSVATGRAIDARPVDSLARTAGRIAGRLTRQSPSSTIGLYAAGAAAGATAGAGGATGADGATGAGVGTAAGVAA